MAQDERAERTLLIEQAVVILGLSRRTVYYRIREGRLQTIRTRCGSQRVTLASIEQLLQEMRARAEARVAARNAAVVERRGVSGYPRRLAALRDGDSDEGSPCVQSSLHSTMGR